MYLNIIKTVIGALGIVGNGLVCVVIARVPAMRTRTNAIIFNQAAVDFLASVLVIIMSYVQPPLHDNEVLAMIQCHLWNNRIVLWVCFISSTFNLVLLTLERYVAIMYPFKYVTYFTKQRVAVMLVAVWFFAAGFALRIVQFHQVVEGNCVESNSSRAQFIADGTLTLAIEYLIPLIIMTFCYIHIAVYLKKRASDVIPGHPNNQNENSMTASLFRARRNTLKTLFIVFVTYVICWSPNQTIFFMYHLGRPLYVNSPSYIITVVLVQLNTCVNPIIYSFKYKQFQRGVRILLKPLFPGLGTRPEENTFPTIAPATSQAGGHSPVVDTSLR